MFINETSNSPSEPLQLGLEIEAEKLIDVRNACLAARAKAYLAAADTDSSRNYLLYAEAREGCMELAESICDRFYRDTALHLIYDLCQRAGDVSNAQIAFGRIETDMIRGNIVDGRPALFD